jgi:hypothetical protein
LLFSPVSAPGIFIRPAAFRSQAAQEFRNREDHNQPVALSNA